MRYIYNACARAYVCNSSKYLHALNYGVMYAFFLNFFFGISNFKNATTMYFYFQTKSSIMHVSVILHSPMSYTRDNALVTYTKKGERPIAQILQSLSRIFILLMRI